MSAEILTKLNLSRKELLDIGLRNPLINYRTRVKKIDVVDELSNEIFKILVSDGKSMTFNPIPEEYLDEEGKVLKDLFGEEDENWASIFSDEDEDDTEKGFAIRHVDTKLQTKLTSLTMHKRLLALHNDARTYIEEQGVNILYLSLGFLHWFESESSEILRRAPLILVPVELTRSDVRSRFRLSYSGEDIGSNLSLQEKLKLEFAIELPGLDDENDINIQTYIDHIERKIPSHLRWEVKRDEIVLGFFSFGKFLMYKDLDNDNWPDQKKPVDHPIVSALLSEGFRDEPHSFPDGEDLDKLISPTDVHHVMDADSTQVLAIMEAKLGNNMVIQGPPGTGKSQTITNIIAENIGEGKKILFISEKMAALEVVKRRLDFVGLGDAVLELHSHKTHKKKVLEELDRTLNLGRPLGKSIEDDIQTYINIRDRLNSYCEAVNKPLLNTHISPIKAIGHYLKLGDGLPNLPSFDFENMKKWSDSEYKQNLLRIEELQRRISVLGVPKKHPFWGVKRTVLLPSDEHRVHNQIEKIILITKGLLDKTKKLAEKIAIAEPETFDHFQQLLRSAEKAIEAPRLDGLKLETKDWFQKREQIYKLLISGYRLAEIHDKYDKYFVDEAWDQDLLEVQQNFVNYGKKWLRIFSGQYRNAVARLKGLMKEPLSKDPEKRLELVKAILNARHEKSIFEEHHSIGIDLFGTQWERENSDWTKLISLSDWMRELHKDIDDLKIPYRFLNFLKKYRDSGDISEQKRIIEELIAKRKENTNSLYSDLNLKQVIWKEESININELDYLNQLSILNKWNDNFNTLREIVDYNVLSAEFDEINLNFVLQKVEEWGGALEDIVRSFESSWYEGLIESAFSERKELQRFNRESHEHTLEKFIELDRLLLDHNKRGLADKHWNFLPRFDSGGELGVIRREINKQRRHLPIRKLVGYAGRAMQAIKPVFMMSPMSVAKYIPPGEIEFDLVVFDEASQIKPVDSFGAILRGKQAVVVGDNKQLPPTSFFDTLIEAADDDEYDFVTGDIESVLNLFLAQNSHERMLRWHYRSRHDSLIAVSNYEFYENRLVTFPCSGASELSTGLEFRHLPDTYYDRGKTRANPQEAKTVAEKVMKHARENPELTLGVAAFSIAQRDAILNQLEYLRRKDHSCEDFFKSYPHEPFFIKNLENVQGDERDVIFISVGYGKSKDGHFTHNFGPLNREGGERRLNVLITRARHVCKVFANFLAEDIDLRRTNARGVVALKTFLSYAKDRSLDIIYPTGQQPDSPFEEEVIKEIRGLGYEIEPQVGSAGFRIDIGVIDSDRPGRYLIGIECDGATYHSAQSARDRDRLRQEVLEGLGWRIHRIWSTDWFRDPKKELERVVEAIERAKAYWTGFDSGGKSTKQSQSVSQTIINRTDETQQDDASIETKPYRKADIHIHLGNNELHNIGSSILANYITQIVEVEAPVHKEVVILRVIKGAGLKKAGNRIRNTVNGSIKYSIRKRYIKDGGDGFLWKIDQSESPIRDRSNLESSDKKIGYVAKEEIAFALCKVICCAFSINCEEALSTSLRMLGFKRITSKVRKVAEEVLNECIATGKIILTDNILTPHM